MSKIIASIVLYGNEISILKQAIDSFLNTDLDITLILIDNSPSDLLRILQFDNRINYIHNPSNPGFGSSHNIALQKSLDLNADYHLVLNPDIYFSSGTLENIVDFMNENKNIGHLMPKILYPNGEFQFLCKKNPTFFDLFIRGFLPSFLKNKFAFRLNNYLYKFANFNDIIFDVPYLSGCFMFFRISTLKKVGFFDEKIFMYFFKSLSDIFNLFF